MSSATVAALLALAAFAAPGVAAAQQPLLGHQSSVTGVAFAPQGDVVATAGLDRAVKLWNVKDGAELRAFPEAASQILSLDIDRGGRLLATGARDNSIQLWDLQHPLPLLSWPGHTAPISRLAALSDTALVSISDDKTVVVWNRETGEALAKLPPFAALPTAVAVSADAKWLAIGDEQGQIHLFAADAWDKPAAVIGAHQSRVGGLAFHPTQPQLLSHAVEGLLKRWALPVEPPRVLPARAVPAIALAATPDGGTMLSIGADKALLLHSLAAVAGQETRKLADLAAEPRAVAIAADGKRAAVGDSVGGVHLFDVADGKLLGTLQASPEAVSAVAFSPQNTHLLSVGADALGRVWKLPQPAPALTAVEFPAQSVAAPTAAAVSGDGKWLALAGPVGGQHAVVIRSAETGAVRATLSGHTAPILSVALSADGSRAVTGSSDKTSRFWDATNGKELSQAAHETVIRSVAVAANGQLAFSGGDDNQIHQWNPANGEPVRMLPGHTGAVTHLSVAGAVLFSGAADGTIRSWNTANGAAVRSFANAQPVTALAASADAAYVAGTGANHQVKVFDAANAQVVATLPAPGQAVSELAVAGGRVAVSAADAVRVFDLEGNLLERIAAPAARGMALSSDGQHLTLARQDGALLTRGLSIERVLGGHTGAVTGAAWLPSGAQVVTSGVDKIVRIWNVADGATVRDLPGAAAAVQSLSVSGDGAIIAAIVDKTVLLWKSADGAAQAPLTLGAAGSSVALSPTGALAATGAADGVVQLWDVAGGKGLLLQTLTTHTPGATLTLLHDKQLTSTGVDKRLEAAAPAALSVTETGEAGGAGQIALLPDGAQVAVLTKTPDVPLWAEAVEPARRLPGLGGPPQAIAVRADGQQLAAADATGKLVIWNLANNQAVATLTLPTPATALAFRSDNAALGACLASGAIQVYSLAEGTPLLQEQKLESPQATLLFGAKSTLITAGADKLIHHWGEASGVPLRTLSGHTQQVNAVVFRPDSTQLVSASSDLTARVWDVATGAAVRQLAGAKGPLYAVDVDAAGALVAAGGSEGIARLWNLETGALVREFKVEEPLSPILDVALHPQGAVLATCHASGQIRLWNTANGAAIRALDGHAAACYSAQFHPAGTRLLTCGQAGELRVWNVADGQPVQEAQADGIPLQAALAPDGVRAAVGCSDGQTRWISLPALGS